MTTALRALAVGGVLAGAGALSYLIGGVAGVCWVALGGTAVLALALRARWASPRVVTPPDPPQSVAGPGRFDEYEQWASRLSSAIHQYRYFDRAVRPRLYRLTVAIFAHRHGPGDPAVLADRLGPEVWSLLDPDRPPWEDEFGERRSGPSVDQLRLIIERIEAL